MPNRERWWDRANCKEEDVELFFEADLLAAPRREARRICEACSVRQACLDEHVDIPFGMYGGLTWTERRVYSETVLGKPVGKWTLFPTGISNRRKK